MLASKGRKCNETHKHSKWDKHYFLLSVRVHLVWINNEFDWSWSQICRWWFLLPSAQLVKFSTVFFIFIFKTKIRKCIRYFCHGYEIPDIHVTFMIGNKTSLIMAVTRQNCSFDHFHHLFQCECLNPTICCTLC